MDVKLYVNEWGYPKAICPSSLEILGWYLEQDLQRSPESCEQILQIIESVQKQKQNIWEGTGNAHTVTIEADTTTIVNEFTNLCDTCLIPTNEFIDTVIAWRDFIKIIRE